MAISKFTLVRLRTIVPASLVILVLIMTKMYNFRVMETTISPAPVVHSSEKNRDILSESPQEATNEPFFVTDKTGATTTERNIDDVTESLPSMDEKQDQELLEDIKKINNSYLRFDAFVPPWFDREDVLRMQLVSGKNVSDAFSFENHGRIKQVIFEDGSRPRVESFSKCLDHCGLQKSAIDIHEVFAFHMDRVLGLNRAPPTVARRIDRKQTRDGVLRVFGPMVWWDPDIRHSGTFQPVQNSMALSWTDYQRGLTSRCFARDNMEKSKRNPNCTTKIRHIEWGKLAMYDFILQNHDRIDRNCCGYDRAEGESCLRNGPNELKCRDVRLQFLVHIFTHTHDESRLVFIDNVFNLHRSIQHLNYRILEGIQEIPEYPISILKSGKFRDMMLQSLYIDKVYWESQGGKPFMEKLISVIEERAQKLITYIERASINLVPDY